MKIKADKTALPLALTALMFFSCGFSQIDTENFGDWQGRKLLDDLTSISADEELEYGTGVSLTLTCFGGEFGDFGARIYGFDGARFDGFQDISMRVATEDGPVEIALAPSEESDQLLIDPDKRNLNTFVDAIVSAADSYDDLRIETTVGYFSEVRVFGTRGFLDALTALPCYSRFQQGVANLEPLEDTATPNLTNVWERQGDFIYTTDANEDGTLAASRIGDQPELAVLVPSVPSQGLEEFVKVMYSFEGDESSISTTTETWERNSDLDVIAVAASSQFNDAFDRFSSEAESTVGIRIQILNADDNAVYDGSFLMDGFSDTYRQLE